MPDPVSVIPATFAAALAAQPSDGTLILADGVYTLPVGSPVQLRGVIQAAPGARPVLTANDGSSPYIEVQNGGVLDGLWFGGTKPGADQPFVIKNDTTIRNCTLFHYYGGIVEGGGTRNVIQGSRFVDCGTATFYHAIYISNSAPTHWALIADNLFIGGAGYSTHVWQLARSVTLARNFYGDVQWMIVLNGLGHVMIDNVMWSNRGTVGALLGCNFSGDPGDGTTSFDVHDNLTGAQTQLTNCTMDANRICYDNTFYAGVPAAYGDSPITVGSVPGIDAAAVNAAIAAIESAFAQSTAAIQADGTIEGQFAVCAAAVATWSA